MDRPLTIPEIRGMNPVPRDRLKPYSPESYAAQYGITVEGAEHLIDQADSHPEIEQRIHVMFSRDELLKQRVLNWHTLEEERTKKRHEEIDRQRAEARRKKIEEAEAAEAAREKAKQELAKKEEAEKEEAKS